METLMKRLKRVLDEHRVFNEWEACDHGRTLVHFNETMYDAGLGAGDVLLDYTIDSTHHGLYIGLIRLPRAYRGRGLGAKMVEEMKHWARERSYSIILESADENLTFWEKEHFAHLLHEDYGFWIMGYCENKGAEDPDAKDRLKANWKLLKKRLYPHAS
jgi:GNAT superfamily N-acetyltransferase